MSYDHWMTPPDWIELARRCMGSITVDPASNDIAQQYVKADSYYTIDYSGLDQEWYGNVWLNPPYSRGNIDRFVEKAIEEWQRGDINNMAVLVNSATDAGWYHELLNTAQYLLLVKGRIKFWKIFDGKAHEKWEGEKSKAEGRGKIDNSPRYLNTMFYFTRNTQTTLFPVLFADRGKVITL